MSKDLIIQDLQARLEAAQTALRARNVALREAKRDAAEAQAHMEDVQSQLIAALRRQTEEH